MLKRNINRIIKLKIDKALLDKHIIEKEESTFSELEEQKETDALFNLILPNLEH